MELKLPKLLVDAIISDYHLGALSADEALYEVEQLIKSAEETEVKE